jgi:tRNA G10  N-methylase Trm11
MSSFSHIAILGRQPELGLVELESLLGPAGLVPFGTSAALLTQAVDINRLGGTVKVAEVALRFSEQSLEEVLARPDIADLLANRAGLGKFVFGLSVYGKRVPAAQLRGAGTRLKRELKPRVGSARFVAPTGSASELTAAQLKFNQVLDRGCELVIVYAGSSVVVATTVGVQDIDWYAERDYGRPVRSAKVGMLPPKLAQVLVNTTSGVHVTDPFCGTGVVLQEALLAGRTATGSDLADEMVTACRANLEWLGTKAPAPLPHWSVARADARTVAIQPGTVVVSEGYLGKHLEHSPAEAELTALRAELKDLYTAVITNFASQQKSGAEAAICAPAWRIRGKWHYLEIVDEVARLGYTLKRFKHVRTPLLYARGDQIVGRQLLLLRKN